MSGWRNIESAPEGCCFLPWGKGWEHPAVCERFVNAIFPAEGDVDDDDEAVWAKDGFLSDDVYPATHWHPLPDLPAEEAP